LTKDGGKIPLYCLLQELVSLLKPDSKASSGSKADSPAVPVVLWHLNLGWYLSQPLMTHGLAAPPPKVGCVVVDKIVMEFLLSAAKGLFYFWEYTEDETSDVGIACR
jgi:hypothetical protein